MIDINIDNGTNGIPAVQASGHGQSEDAMRTRVTGPKGEYLAVRFRLLTSKR
jgi:hypothetical protein